MIYFLTLFSAAVIDFPIDGNVDYVLYSTFGSVHIILKFCSLINPNPDLPPHMFSVTVSLCLGACVFKGKDWWFYHHSFH